MKRFSVSTAGDRVWLRIKKLSSMSISPSDQSALTISPGRLSYAAVARQSASLSASV